MDPIDFILSDFGLVFCALVFVVSVSVIFIDYIQFTSFKIDVFHKLMKSECPIPPALLIKDNKNWIRMKYDGRKIYPSYEFLVDECANDLLQSAKQREWAKGL